MFGSGDYANAGYEDSSEGMGDAGFLEYALNLASGLIPGVGTPLPAAAPIVFGGASPAAVITDAVSPSPSSASVTAPSGLKLRSQPSEVTGAVLAQLSPRSVVTIVARDFPPTPAAPKGWTKVRTASGQEGYVTTEWLSISSPTSATSGNTSSALAATSSTPLLNVKEPTEEDGFFSNRLVWIGGGVVAVVLAGALVFGGKKKRK